MDWLLTLLGFKKKVVVVNNVQIAYDVFMQFFKKSHCVVNIKTASTEQADLYVVFRGMHNAWQFRILLENNNPQTQYFFTEPPGEIRQVLCTLSFEEAVRLAHRLKPNEDTETEIPEFIKPVQKHLTLSRGSPPRVS